MEAPIGWSTAWLLRIGLRRSRVALRLASRVAVGRPAHRLRSTATPGCLSTRHPARWT